MLAAAAAGASHPAVAALLGLGASGLAGAVVAMAWSVHARQIRLAELLARRQYLVTGDAKAPEHALNGHNGSETAHAEVQEALAVQGTLEVKEIQGGQAGQGGQGYRPSDPQSRRRQAAQDGYRGPGYRRRGGAGPLPRPAAPTGSW